MWLPGSSARRLPAIALALLISKANLGHAACECGYTSTVATGPTARDWVLFTDLIETDFSREDDVMLNTDWRPQKYDVDKEMARGEYGQQFALRNVDPNPAENPEENSGPGVNGGDSGLILTVESQIVDGMVPGGQIVSSRQDVLHGTFRAGMKLTGISGTCAAFFWYFNDTQEIDMEFLSLEFDFDNDIYPINLVLHSKEAASNGFDAATTNTFRKVNLSFNPTTAFHEYRIDFFETHVIFLADGEPLATMNGSAVPSHPGLLLLSHWSNGNPFWSGGPPSEDASIAVSYVKAYFNSSDRERLRDWESRCTDLNGPDATCAIPDVTPDNNDAATFFFSQQDNMTVNQIISGKNNAAGSIAPVSMFVIGSVLSVSGWIMGIW